MNKLFFSVVDQGVITFEQTDVVDLRGSLDLGVLSFYLPCKKYNWCSFEVGFLGMSKENCPLLSINFEDTFRTKNTKSTIIEFLTLPSWILHSSGSGTQIPITLIKETN